MLSEVILTSQNLGQQILKILFSCRK